MSFLAMLLQRRMSLTAQAGDSVREDGRDRLTMDTPLFERAHTQPLSPAKEALVRQQGNVGKEMLARRRSQGNVQRQPDKRYHFFGSHRKEHSRIGRAPELLAMGIKDCLSERGYCGFFDIDNLKEISREALVRHVLESCCVVVVLDDETCQSPWVALELETAREAAIPIYAVVDQDNFNMQDVISWHLQNNFGHVLHEQVIGCSVSTSHPVLDL